MQSNVFRMNMFRADPAQRLFRQLPKIALLAVALLVATQLLLPSVAYANIYATAIKLNGGFTNAVAGAGTNVLISYILNEGATAGGTIESKSGNTTGRTRSFADEGGYSDGGYDWAHGQFFDDFSPWKLEIAADDRVHVNDHHPLADPGVVLSFDQLISSNSLRTVLDSSNCTNFNSSFSGMAITGPATNLQLWMADSGSGGLGVVRWDATNSGRVTTNDQGATIVQAGNGSDLDQAP